MDDSTLNQVVIIVYMSAGCVFLYQMVSRKDPDWKSLGLHTWDLESIL